MPLKCGLAPATPGRMTGLWPGSSDAEMDDAKARACGRAAADTVLLCSTDTVSVSEGYRYVDTAIF